MHLESMQEMAEFAEKYTGPGSEVLDVGSYYVNGSYQSLFENYVGLDIVDGPNVDIVAVKPYKWNIKSESFDAVVSGQAFEHIEFPEKTMKEIARVLKPGGYCCIIAPSTGPKHDFPCDYRRYDKKSFKALAVGCGLEVVSAVVNVTPIWNDAVLVARKPEKVSKSRGG